MNWINVKDILPEKDNDVIVYCAGNVDRARRSWNGARVIWCKWNQDCGLGWEPTHWAILKEPMAISRSKTYDNSLLLAAKTGAKWMRFWLDNHECECEHGHTCGRNERERELREMESAIFKATGE